MTQALHSGAPVRRRVLFGALDADGWGWATVKALFWFLVLIIMLAYIPDRAYYFTVGRTVELGLPLWTPVNLCPPDNKDLPCPAPAGAVIPWQPSPDQLALPAARTDGSATQVGSKLIYAGGSDGSAATSTTYVADVKDGNFAGWTDGPALPAARTGTAAVVLNGVAYLIGGAGPDGKPTDTVWSIALDQQSGKLGDWTNVDAAKLPEARAGSAAAAVSDGIVVVGGVDASGKPTTTVWKSTLDKDGKLGAFEQQAALVAPIAYAAAAVEGEYVWVYGGTDANGASGAVHRGTIAAPPAIAPGASVAPQPSGAATAAQQVTQWAVSSGINLPEARTHAAGFAANGTIYLLGGSDGQRDRSELYWAVPEAGGGLSSWKHLSQTDLPSGLSGASAVASGSNVFVIGGTANGGLLKTSLRASLAPQEPFFRLGLVGAEVPALMIEGEIGQQLGYLNAAGAGTVDFVILLLIGWAFAHKEQVRGWIARRRAARAAG
jgi:hypothetical protein